MTAELHPEAAALLERSHRLGADPRNTNYAGGNTSAKGTATDPKLPAGKVDLILMVDVYHEFAQPQVMLRRMHDALKADGRLVLLEYRAEDPAVPIRPEHKMTRAQVLLEVGHEGYTLTSESQALPRQHLLVFSKKPN